MKITVHTKNETAGYAAFDSISAGFVFFLNDVDATAIYISGNKLTLQEINHTAFELEAENLISQVGYSDEGYAIYA